MKFLVKKMGFLPFLAIFLVGCGSNPSTTTSVNSDASGLALDTAIEQAAERIEETFTAGTEIALISVSSPSTQFSDYVLTYLESILVNNGKLAVVDRANLDKIRAEQGFQLSGEVSDESAKAIGQMLGAGAIVTGTLVNLGDAYRLTLKAINVETARVAASYPADITNSPRVQTLLASGGGASSGTQMVQRANTGGNTPAQASAPVTPPASVYKIGDTGPSGGIIFSVIFQAGAWKYLEAAPADTEFKTSWNENICDGLEMNGFNDWFLPSRTELHTMYANLHIKGFGDFKTDWYWSSSQEGIPLFPIAENFSDGSQESFYTSKKCIVRAIRQF
jgi:hypothetical protein